MAGDECEYLESLEDVKKRESVRVRVSGWAVQRREGAFHDCSEQSDLRYPIPNR